MIWAFVSSLWFWLITGYYYSQVDRDVESAGPKFHMSLGLATLSTFVFWLTVAL